MAAAPTVACTGTVPVPEVALGIVAPPLCVLGISDLPPPSVFATNEQPANALPGVIVVRASMPGPVIPTYGDWDAESGDVWAGASVGGGWSGSSSSEWEG